MTFITEYKALKETMSSCQEIAQMIRWKEFLIIIAFNYIYMQIEHKMIEH